VFMSRGYHQYGIEWEARPVNLEPMREETRRIVAEERAKREAKLAANSNAVAKPVPRLSADPKSEPLVPAVKAPAVATPQPAAPIAAATPETDQRKNAWWVLLAVLAVFGVSFLLKRQRPGAGQS
jgi:hypothetical protein